MALSRHQFPRHERLTRHSDYVEVYRTGKKQVGEAFICYVDRRIGAGRQFGMAVSRKVGGAVARNRVKRYLREVYRTHRGLISEDLRVVVVARPKSAALTYCQCETALQNLLRKGDVISG